MAGYLNEKKTQHNRPLETLIAETLDCLSPDGKIKPKTLGQSWEENTKIW